MIDARTHRLGVNTDARHKVKGRLKVLELIFAIDRIAICHLRDEMTHDIPRGRLEKITTYTIIA